MGKLYTLDNKLLTETPEIRIGEKIYPVDNRKKTVEKVQRLLGKGEADDPMDGISEAFKLAFGATAAKEIDGMNLPYPAFQELVVLVMAAMTGEDPAAISDRFHQGETKE